MWQRLILALGTHSPLPLAPYALIQVVVTRGGDGRFSAILCFDKAL
jgi:hypothetical protein